MKTINLQDCTGIQNDSFEYGHDVKWNGAGDGDE